MNRLHFVLGVTLIGTTLVGCQSADEPPPGVPLVDVMDATVSAESSSESANVTAVANESEPSKSDAPVAAAFDPPFPHRTELFDPPRGGQSMIRRDDEHGDTIELKGFVDVDGPQVVLAIDGIISPIPEGGERFGVQVISIHPPSVVLQRGRSRWTASLE